MVLVVQYETAVPTKANIVTIRIIVSSHWTRRWFMRLTFINQSGKLSSAKRQMTQWKRENHCFIHEYHVINFKRAYKWHKINYDGESACWWCRPLDAFSCSFPSLYLSLSPHTPNGTSQESDVLLGRSPSCSFLTRPHQCSCFIVC